MSCRFPMRAQLECRHAPLYTCILQSTGKVDRNGRSQPDPPRTQRSKPSAMPEIVASEKTSRNNKRGKEFDTQSCNDADQTVKWIRTKLLTWYYPIIFLDFCLHKCPRPFFPMASTLSCRFPTGNLQFLSLFRSCLLLIDTPMEIAFRRTRSKA
jgi:hypothetical protein